MGSDEPLYNIGVVARMTDIPVATLRVWERRYGFPQSERTAGGHRLYSEREVLRLRWIKARIEEGMQIGQAVRALHHLEQGGRFPEAPLVASVETCHAEDHLSVFEERLTTALIDLNTDKADQLLGEMLALYPLEDLILSIISPTMAELGRAWEDKQISVATEHLATHYLRQRLVMWMMTGPPAYRVRPVVLACAPGEWHEGSLLILGVLLRRRRWPMVYLGQSTPLPDLAEFVRETRPQVVVVVAMTEESAGALTEWPRWLPEAAEMKRPIIAYGGRAFTEQPEWRERVPGIFLGSSLREGIEKLDSLLHDITSPMF